MKQEGSILTEHTFATNCVDSQSYSIYKNLDWMYSYIEACCAYSLNLSYIQSSLNLLTETFDFFFVFLWSNSLDSNEFQLFYSVMLDNYINNKLIQLHLTDEWSQNFFSSKEATFVLINHPELVFFKSQLINSYYSEYLTDISFSSLQFLQKQSLLSPVLLVPQILLLLLSTFLFVSFYFSYYSNPVKEEASIDSDYLSASISIESEKELGSIDDLLIIFIMFLSIFGWYFYSYCYALICSMPETALFFFIIPLFSYVIIMTPLLLLLDFGIVFIAYVKGVTPTSNLAAELIFDYVSIIAYFVRVFIQCVRLALMFGTYCSMHDFILYANHPISFFSGGESIWEDFSNTSNTKTSFTYFIFSTLPLHLANWGYELIHTLFVLTSQTISYVGMIFWLFLFLFTSFVSEKQENFFSEKRNLRKKSSLFFSLFNKD